MYQLPSINNQLTKTQLNIIAEDSVTKLIDSGYILESIEAFTKMEYLIKEIKSNKNFIDFARDEISKYGKNYITETGTKIELAEVGVKYDFSYCGDIVLLKLLKEQETLENAIKERKEFLKHLPQSGTEVLFEDEVIKVYPASKSSSSSLKTTIS
jgi:hypothetical protein